jgi:hypothetical protein
MWIFTPFGFFSIVQKPGDTKLTVRARVAEDLDNLRTRVPGLGETVAGAGTDYRYRATVSPTNLGIGLAQIIRGLDYSNFKTEVHRQQGPARAAAYGLVWGQLLDLGEMARPDKSSRRQTAVRIE